MSLADELLADLEEGDEELEYGYRDNENTIEEAMEVPDVDESDAKSVRHVAKLRDGKELNDVLSGIEKFSSSTSGDKTQEYKLIVDANNLTVEIDNEINIIHKYLRDLYAKRFPELESLIPNALDYIRTVELLGNDLEAMKVDLTDVLPPATKMVVSVTASTTQGEKLEEEELGNLVEACGMANDLLEAKVKIFEYVESRMTYIAPNLSTIVGAPTAAKLMGSAGGLTGLSKMPACNILLLGSQKKTLSGFSSTVVLPHTGHVYFSEVVQVSFGWNPDQGAGVWLWWVRFIPLGQYGRIPLAACDPNTIPDYRHGHVNSVKVKIKFHPKSKLCFPCAWFLFQQIPAHWTNIYELVLRLSIDWSSCPSLDLYQTWKQSMKTALNSSLFLYRQPTTC